MQPYSACDTTFLKAENKNTCQVLKLTGVFYGNSGSTGF